MHEEDKPEDDHSEVTCGEEKSAVTESSEPAASSVEQLCNMLGLHEQTVPSPLPVHSSASMPSEDNARESIEERASTSSTYQDITVRQTQPSGHHWLIPLEKNCYAGMAKPTDTKLLV